VSRLWRAALVVAAILILMQLAGIVAYAAIVRCFGPLRYCDEVAGYLTTVALGCSGAALASVLLGRYAMERDASDDGGDGGGPREPVPPPGPPPVARAPEPAEAAARVRDRKRAIDLFHTVADVDISLLKDLTGHSRPIEYPYVFLTKTISDIALGGDPLHGLGAGLLDLARLELEESVKKGLAGSLDDIELFGMRAARLLAEPKPAATAAATSPVAGAEPDFGPVGMGRLRDWRPGSFARGGSGAGAGRREELTSRLSHATRYVGIAHAARDVASEWVILFEPATSVVLLNTEHGVTIIEPAPLADIVDDLRALVGPAEAALPLAAVLPHAQGLALAAVIDLERERLLRGAARIAIGAGDVVRIADRDDRQLLAAHLRGDLGIDWGRAEPATALDGLVEPGWLAREGDGWLPAPNLTGLAWRYLLLERVLRIRAGRVGENGALTGLDLLCVLGLSGDLLLVERDEERVRFTSASGPDLADGVGRLLLQPEALTDLAPAR
jgi:hypothetical protein